LLSILTYKKKYAGYLKIIFLFLSGFIVPGLYAQYPDIVFTHFDQHNFLTSSRVNCVFQDSKSFFWIATDNGIQRYDCSRWIWLKQEKNEAATLPDNNVLSFLEDCSKRFWVLTASGVCLLNRNNFHFKKVEITGSPASDFFEPQSLVQLNDGHIWLILKRGGIYCYDETKNKFVDGSNVIPDTAHVIYQLVYDAGNAQYWLATDKGIVAYNRISGKFLDAERNPQKLSIFQMPEAKEKIFSIHLTQNGRLWFASFKKHVGYDTQTDKIIFTDTSTNGEYMLGYFTDIEGTTWSYGENIAKMDIGTGKMEFLQKTPGSTYGIDFETASFMTEDKEHNYWFATTNGLFIYNRFFQQFFSHKIKKYSTGEILKSTYQLITGFVEMPDSSIIVLTWGGEGLYYFDKKMNQLPKKFNLGDSSISNWDYRDNWSGITDNENNVWIGCQHGTLLKLYPGSNRIEKFKDTAFNNQSILSCEIDKEGNLWFGTSQQVIVRRDVNTGKFTRVLPPHADGLGVNYINQLYYDGLKYLWAATSTGGLLKINTLSATVEKQYKPQTGNDKSIPSLRIRDIIGVSVNELMMATPVGIVLMNTTTENFRLLNTGDGLPNNNIFLLLNGEKRTVWFAGSSGISKIALDGMKVTNYGLLEGLSNEKFLQVAKLKLRDGRMIFSSSEGFTIFDPAKFLKDRVPTNVTITGIKLFDSYLDVDSIMKDKNEMVLNYRQNFLTIEFSNMSFFQKDKEDYYYKMEGIDNNWIKAGEKQQATYTYLPGGKYRFMVKCKSKAGIESEKSTSFNIYIIPPIWKQWWFYLLCVLVAVSITYLLLRARNKRKIEAERVRSRIARDLHDDMGSTLSTINILSEMAKKKIDTDIPDTKKFIHQISDNSVRMMESMDDIVWNIDPSNESMENVLSRMREFAGNLLEASGINYSFREDKEVGCMNLELGKRHDLFMIFKEAVNNLAKHSGCCNAAIELSVKKNILQLLITDNGKGFKNDGFSEGNGIGNLYKRAAALQGTLSIESQVNLGTKIELKIPV